MISLAKKHFRIVTNAGGLNPLRAALEIERMAQKLGLQGLRVAVVEGDDFLNSLETLNQEGILQEMAGNPAQITEQGQIYFANAYLGAKPIVEALRTGADIILTGRVTDSSLFLAPLIYEFGWSFTDYDRLAQGIVLGHLMECSGQCGGGWMNGAWQAYFSEEHKRLRQDIRVFVRERITPQVPLWEEQGVFPKDILLEMGRRGYLGLRYSKDVGGYGGDYFMDIILAEELARSGAGGFPLAIAVQTDMANPPILQFGTPEQIARYFTPAIRGEKLGAIGITEPNHGSDVASIQTRAFRKDGRWIINGSKTFITNGLSADHVVLVTRTLPQPGFKGISLIIVDMDAPGVAVSKKLNKLGMHSSDTGLIMFEDAEVPEENLLGQEGRGFYQIMWELQGERLIGAAGALGTAEYLLEVWDEQVAGRGLGRRHGQAKEEVWQLKAEVQTVKLFNYGLVKRFMDGEYDAQLVAIDKYYAARLAYRVAERLLILVGNLGVEKDNVFENDFGGTHGFTALAGARMKSCSN